MRPPLRLCALLLLALAALAAPPAASAHALGLPTARVSLRDGHIEVQLDLDLLPLLGGDPTVVATAAPPDLARRLQESRALLQRESRLLIDQTSAPLTLRAFPAADEVRAACASLSAAGHGDGARVLLRFESPASALTASAVSLALPAALGPAVITFVQPATQYVGPGAPARFAVLATPPAKDPAAERARWLLIGAVAAVLAVALNLTLSRRKEVAA